MATELIPENEEFVKRNKGRINRQWVPKRWRPEYERIVAFSVCGKANTWIAEQMGFTTVHVSNILNLPQAVALAEKLHARLRENVEMNVPQVLSEISTKALERVKAFVSNDTLFEKNPFAVVDRSMRILENTVLQKAVNPTSPLNIDRSNVLVLSPAQQDSVSEGLKKLQEIKQLHDVTPTNR